MSLWDFLWSWMRQFAPPHFRWTLEAEGFPAVTFDTEEKIMKTITDTQKFSCGIQPTSAKGNPARVDGVPVWTVSDPALLTLQVADDGMGAEVFAVGALGNAQVVVTADADLGAGVRTITGILDVTVIGGEAATLAINAGTPEEQ